MFIFEVVGICFIEKKNLYVLHVEYDRVGVTGKAVEVVYVFSDRIDGGSLSIGSLIRVYRNNRGFVEGVEVV